MGKFNIVSKSPSRNVLNKKYEITYQVNGQGATMFKTEVVCFDKVEGRYKFVFSYNTDKPFINSTEDGNEFINELYLFSLGANYRRTHPVLRSKVDELKEKRQKLSEQITDINTEINKLQNEEFKKTCEHFKQQINNKSLNKFTSQLQKYLIDDNYYISTESKFFNVGVNWIYSKDLNKPVKKLICDKGNIEIRDLDEDDLRWIL